ncbi:globin family protein [Renibacterium salmoninarum ATCC 33209]|uniref:Globin family protein n=1 Tax=Renibacterium salmoninarum (strain ATCC 33209 / DSM 20767 / JCM 11484 / NBRC 15589 / NCIMB 2235) TaxID=288705 RepID=A9WUY3_RENSM|nr:globin [Renibacterium salmoninarum]ABY25004.1 globin family protein [Renibacterium salmoninarum ATCC 33209]
MTSPTPENPLGQEIPSRFGQPLARLIPTSGAASTFTAPPENFYETVGGHATFVKLVHEFYLRVAQDEILRPMYPEDDLAPAECRMLMFLEQYWGGPKTYLEERGHPRLRMRHAPFAVTPAARDRWLDLMRAALDATELSPLHDGMLWDYLDRAAHSMVNSA